MFYCPTCSTPIEEGTRTCPNCGRNVDENIMNVLVKAPLLERFLASLIDNLICVLLGIPAIICYKRGCYIHDLALRGAYDYSYSYRNYSSGREAVTYFLAALVLFIIFSGVYAFVKDGLGNGQSLGKRVMGLKVVKVSDGGKCTIGLSALRALVGNLIVLLPCIGYFIEPIMVLATDDGRRLADRAAGTMVISAN